MHGLTVLGRAICCAVLVILIAGCTTTASTPTSTPEPQPLKTITISGSGTVSGVLDAVKDSFEAANPSYTLNVLSGSGTGGGVSGVLDGSLDVAAMARPAKDTETEQGLEYVGIGEAGVAFISHRNLTVDNLTQEQAKAIFFGEVTNWSEVGGPDLDIVVYVRDEDETATQALRTVFFGEDPFPDSTAAVLTSLGDMLASIEGTPGSIGFATWPGVKARQSTVHSLNLDGKAPGEEGYAVLTSLGVGYAKESPELAQVLLTFLESQDGQAALKNLDVLVAED